MHTRASNSELVEPLLEPERTLNRRRRRRNRRVPFDQRNNPPKNPRIVYPPILDINHFRHFLVTLENLYPMDDEPMWAADHVVAPTPGSAITIPETANEFAIKATLVAAAFASRCGSSISKPTCHRHQQADVPPASAGRRATGFSKPVVAASASQYQQHQRTDVPAASATRRANIISKPTCHQHHQADKPAK
ncbi:hypothetical protein Tco_0874252 [Tanacetum coccineum]|uniref:Uncharacterized protein n=1 Tax=Tanacetum coccineum TaxID=301880 RepID=A0ABQ5BL44_9ASTR